MLETDDITEAKTVTLDVTDVTAKHLGDKKREYSN